MPLHLRSPSSLSRLVLVGEGEVLRHSRLDLHLHLIVHVPLRLASAAVHNHYIDSDKRENDSNNESGTNAVTINDIGLEHGLLFVESLEALVGRLCETGANCIEHAQRLDLSTVSLLVNDNRGVDIGSILIPVGNFFVDLSVVGGSETPFRLICPAKTVLNALHCIVKIHVHVLVSSA